MTREEAIKVLRKSIDNSVEMTIREWEEFDKQVSKAIDMAIEALSADGVGRYENAMQKLREMPKYLNGVKEKQIEKISAEAVQKWIPLEHDGLGTDFPYERDGQWVIVTDGKSISVERVKKDAYDHFYPNGRWFELDDVIAWMPLPTPYKGGDDE